MKLHILYFTIIFTFCISLQVLSQSDNYSQFYNNEMGINPANTGIRPGIRTSLLHRHNFYNAPYKSQNTGFTIDFYDRKLLNGGIGITANSASKGKGLYTHDQFGFSYGKRIGISPDLIFQLGIRGEYNSKTAKDFLYVNHFDYGIGFTDTLSLANTSINYFDYSAGAIVVFNLKKTPVHILSKNTIGFSVNRLAQHNENWNSSFDQQLKLQTNLHWTSDFLIGGDFQSRKIITPGAFYQCSSPESMFSPDSLEVHKLSYGVNISFPLTDKFISRINAGVWMKKHFYGEGMNEQQYYSSQSLSTEALSIMFGVEKYSKNRKRKTKIAYSYDLPQTNYRDNNNGVHEITLSYELNDIALPGSRACRRGYIVHPADRFFHMGYSGGGYTHRSKNTAIYYEAPVEHNTESYDVINENNFKTVINEPLSTFSIDVDKASYSNVRRMINGGHLPNKDAIRIEEMINYFSYDYPEPITDDPFSTIMEYGECPWNTDHQLALIGIKGKSMDTAEIPPSNLVFLLDVSGSMDYQNKLPLLKKSFKVLVDNLRPQDRVAIVVYAGASGEVLPSTSGDDKKKILSALDKLSAGGSTAGGEGIELAYKIAQKYFIEGGNNRVILATDGDFNVGPSSDAEMVRLIEKKRDNGVFLSILGYGMGNYKDSKMEQLSNAGNGNYAYIDNESEANKTFGTELWGTLFTIAKDVKIQVEFNPRQVKAYRLIGYENRLLNNEDFNDDKKDAGEIGSGHMVTALYEIIPADSQEEVTDIDPLKYQKTKVVRSKELMTLKLRYKLPDEDESKLIVHDIKELDINVVTDNFYFSAAVAEYGMLLRDSEFKNDASYAQVLSLAQQAKGEDKYGYRKEFIELVEKAKKLTKKQKQNEDKEE